MGKYILNSVRKLKGIDVSKAILDVGVHNKLRESENFTTQVERISKSRFLAFFGSQRSTKSVRISTTITLRDPLYGLQVHVVVEVKII
jgi:hypothetical protein